MSTWAIQGLVAFLIGSMLLLLVLGLARRGLLSLRYALGWLAVGFLTLTASAFLGTVPSVSRFLHTSPSGFFLLIVSGFLLLVALQLSISLSGLQDAVRDLSEANALLEDRLRTLEEQTDAPPLRAVSGSRGARP